VPAFARAQMQSINGAFLVRLAVLPGTSRATTRTARVDLDAASACPRSLSRSKLQAWKLRACLRKMVACFPLRFAGRRWPIGGHLAGAKRLTPGAIHRWLAAGGHHRFRRVTARTTYGLVIWMPRTAVRNLRAKLREQLVARAKGAARETTAPSSPSARSAGDAGRRSAGGGDRSQTHSMGPGRRPARPL